jgi:Uma2 family endonuclease
MTATGIRMTAEDLLRLPDNHRRHELIDGELHEMPLHGGEHGFACGRVAGRLGAFLERHPEDLGGLFATGTGFWLTHDPDTVRVPDVAFVSKSRLSRALVPGYPETVPDLVVEVVSPSDLADELQIKIEQWLRAGSGLVWAVYPETRSAMGFRQGGSVALLHADDVLTGEPVLPGFECKVNELFDRRPRSRS